MRTKIVKVANKDILIQEKTIGEIKKIVNDLNIDFSKLMQTELEKENFLNEVLLVIQDRIEILFHLLKLLIQIYKHYPCRHLSIEGTIFQSYLVLLIKLHLKNFLSLIQFALILKNLYLNH